MDKYVHKTPQSPPPTFPGLNLKVGKMNCRLGNLDPNLAKMFEKWQKLF